MENDRETGRDDPNHGHVASERLSRQSRLQAIRDAGIDPYPERCHADSRVAELLARSDGVEGNGSCTIAGRIRAIRDHGRIVFIDLQDPSGTMQLVCKDNVTEGDGMRLLRLLDVGDIIEATGSVGLTRRGEMSLFVEQIGMLSKALRPLPGKTRICRE